MKQITKYWNCIGLDDRKKILSEQNIFSEKSSSLLLECDDLDFLDSSDSKKLQYRIDLFLKNR